MLDWLRNKLTPDLPPHSEPSPRDEELQQRMERIRREQWERLEYLREQARVMGREGAEDQDCD